MPQYDFQCEKCNEVATHTFRMSDTEGRENVKCECGAKMKRLFEAPAAIVKTTLKDMPVKPNQTFVDVDGQPVRMNFIDHGDRSGLDENSFAKQHGARFDEKLGQPVVDVAAVLKAFNQLQKTDITVEEIMAEKTQNHLRNDMNVAAMHLVNGTPTMFFDGKVDVSKLKYKTVKTID